MDLQELDNLLSETRENAEKAIAEADTVDALRSAEGRITKGPLADALKNIKSFDAKERGAAGQASPHQGGLEAPAENGDLQFDFLHSQLRQGVVNELDALE